MKNREITVVSFSFSNQPTEKILSMVRAEARKGCDLIMLPETWTGNEPEPLEGGTTAALRLIAKEFGAYISNAVALKTEEHARSNSSVLIGRNGEICGIYHKMYPYWGEYDEVPRVFIGEEAPVFETDFGRVGMAICFDANFNRVWQELSDNRADIVLWSSAYSAGTSLQAHALNYNYAIVSSTLAGDCVVYDMSGEELFYQKAESGEVLVSRVALNTNRAIFHENFNMEGIEKLLAEHEITLEKQMTREQWILLRGTEREQVKELAKAYGLEELPEYKRRSRREIDRMREAQRK